MMIRSEAPVVPVHFSHEEGDFTMTSRIALGASLSVALLLGGTLAAESLESGPAVGKNIPGPFNPLNVTGKSAGQKVCQV
jgi:hypothetical protein